MYIYIYIAYIYVCIYIHICQPRKQDLFNVTWIVTIRNKSTAEIREETDYSKPQPKQTTHLLSWATES